MEQDHLPCGKDASEQERFERVWRRVAPEPRSDCPFTLYSDEERRLMPGGGELTTPPEDEPLPLAVELGLAPMTPMAGSAGMEEGLSLTGFSPRLGELLQEFISDELTDAATYRGMVRRVTGHTARLLSDIGEEERRHAKRLSAAYFLLSGVRFWPERLPGTPMSTFLGGVRQRFLAEQKGERAYRKAAAETSDPYLKELFLELAGSEATHAWLLRRLLEQL